MPAPASGAAGGSVLSASVVIVSVIILSILPSLGGSSFPGRFSSSVFCWFLASARVLLYKSWFILIFISRFSLPLSSIIYPSSLTGIWLFSVNKSSLLLSCPLSSASSFFLSFLLPKCKKPVSFWASFPRPASISKSSSS